MNTRLMLLGVIPPLVLLGYWSAVQRGGESLVIQLAFLVPSSIALGAALLGLWRVTAEIQRRRLGMQGEQVVGQILNELLREGCLVFHDFPQEGWNIDHVIVSPTGVYAVETKTRRKLRGEDEKWGYKVRFDGKALHYEGIERFESRPIGQARRNAADLAAWLNVRVGQPVDVTAIVVLPGWMVSREGKSDVLVMNPKEVRAAVSGREKLPGELRQRICAAIESQCRDVEW